MPLNQQGDIVYQKALVAGVRYQAEPPVCNACEAQVTAGTYGRSWLAAPTPDGPRGLYELIECRACYGRAPDVRALERFRAAHPVGNAATEEEL